MELKKIIEELIKNNIDLRYITNISINEGIKLNKQAKFKECIIEYGKLKLTSKLKTILKQNECKYSLIYVGEITPNKNYSKSFLCKRTEKELEKINEIHYCQKCKEFDCNEKNCKILKILK